jgi:hypothetical protein
VFCCDTENLDVSREKLRSGACKVELRFPHDGEARQLAGKLRRIFEACEFECETVRELSSPARGVRVETHFESEHIAAMIYDAFTSAGVRASFTTSWKNPADTVVVRLGREDAI